MSVDEAAQIRPGEDFDRVALEAWLHENVSGLSGKMEARQFPGGHANLTYLVRFAGRDERELVVRRPPLGPVAPKSHDMGREFRVLSRLADHFDAAPRAYAFCDDVSVIGAIFIVMERCRGIVVRGDVPKEIERQPHHGERMSRALIDTMADFHDVDFAAIGLGDLGHPEGYAERQVRGWKGRWDAAKEHDSDEFEALHAWLVENLPDAPGASLVHNDLKFDNVMFDPEDCGRVTAVLDWDMTTLGDPLIDLGTLLGYWAEASDPPERTATAGVTARAGFPDRAWLVDRYAEKRGIDVSQIGWYEAFALWKTAVVLQQIYIRFVRGQTDDARFQSLGQRVPVLIRLGSELAGRA